MADVKLIKLCKSYGPVDVIKGVDLDIKHGEFVVFVGPSGCGKSTLLRMIAGLEEISSGELHIDNQACNDVQPRERGVAIGRSIVRNPAVFLFDEPLSNLDAALQVDMRMEIGKLHKDLGTTMIYVTHDQVEAMTLADRIVVLNHGVVQQVGAPMQLYHHPANQFVAGFLGSPKMNFLEVDVQDVAGDRITVSSPALDPFTMTHAANGFAKGGKAILGVRPQYLTPDTQGRLHGTVALAERLGTETVVDVALTRGGRVIVALGQDASFAPGQNFCWAFHPSAHICSRPIEADLWPLTHAECRPKQPPPVAR